ncbi:stressosome-associated protein Prli42 [Gorillibacterium sp. sgz5001074]
MINKKLMRVVVWLMLAAMLFSTVLYAVTAIMGI